MTQAIVLAGGKGTRLQSVVSDVPKPMAPVANKPFLTYLLDQLNDSGIDEVILSVGYKHEVIQYYFGHRFKRLKLTYVVENEPLGTGGGIRLAAEKCTSNDIYILNGDTYFSVDLEAMMKEHMARKSGMTLALKHLENVDRYGMVEVEGNRVIRFAEKSGQLETGLINGGIYCLNRDAFLNRTKAGRFSMEVDFMEKELKNITIGGFQSDGYFIDIGIPEDYTKANQYFEQKQN